MEHAVRQPEHAHGIERVDQGAGIVGLEPGARARLGPDHVEDVAPGVAVGVIARRRVPADLEVQDRVVPEILAGTPGKLIAVMALPTAEHLIPRSARHTDREFLEKAR